MQKGRGILVLLIIVAAVALLVWWIAKNSYELTPGEPTDSGIKNSQDLENLDKELDSADLNQMDPDIKELEKESSNF
jgi:hypothetical protein